MNNDECKHVFDAARTLPEEGAIAALAGLVDKLGPTIVLTMLATVCMSLEKACREQAQAQAAQGGNVLTFTVPPHSDKLN